MSQVRQVDTVEYRLILTEQEATDLRKTLIGDASADPAVAADVVQQLSLALGI